MNSCALLAFSLALGAPALNAYAQSSDASSPPNPGKSASTVQAAFSPIVAKPVTGSLIIRVYADSGNHYSELIGEKQGTSGRWPGVNVHVNETVIGPPPLRNPLLLLPGRYQVTVAYPDRRYGRYFDIETTQVNIAPGQGVLVRMQPGSDDWWRRGSNLRVAYVEKGATSEQLRGYLNKWLEEFQRVRDNLANIATNNYLQQLNTQYQQSSDRAMLMDLDAADPQNRSMTKVSLEINSEQVRWVGSSIIEEYDLDDFSDDTKSYASRVVEEIDKIAAQAVSLGDNNLATQAIQERNWVREIISAVSSVRQQVNSVIRGLANRLDGSATPAVQDDTEDPNQLWLARIHQDITGITFSGNKQAILQTYYGLLSIDLLTSNPEEHLDELGKLNRPYTYLWQLSVSPQGRLVSSGGEGFGSHGFIAEWDTGRRRAVRYIENSASKKANSLSPPIVAFAWSADGSKVATCSGVYDPMLKLWNSQTWKVVWAVEAGLCHSVAVAPDGNSIVAGLEDGTLAVYSASDGRQIRRAKKHTTSVRAIQFSRDGERIISGSDNGTILVSEASSDKLLLTLIGHIGAVEQLVNVNNPSQILSAGEDGTLRLWDVFTGKEIASMQGHTGAIRALAVSRNGEQALSGGEDGSLRLWRLAP